MREREKRWVRVRPLTTGEKATIATTCERFIEDTLKPRFLPEVRPTPFNYPIDIFGKWRGSKSIRRSRASIMWKSVSRKPNST